ncbi:uncharacterized protein LOC124620039 [Schistocerca americana]|uniref:uncharacterized protein LOC124620039 n=1 Tax=Schistocerca americana TaxID=7009 RepID=UPI001F4FACA0|nr:uncharacterized protein LOC124620039 [Schistocerca americana]
MLAAALCCRWRHRRHRRVAFLKKSQVFPVTPAKAGGDDANNNMGHGVGEPPPHRDSRSTTVEEFAIPQKPVLARAGNVRQDTSILLTAPPASVMTPPAELSFLPPVEPPPSAAVSPRPPSAATQLELELDASLDCRSLDEAEAAQSQILEPPHSSGSSAEAAAALQQSHRSAKLRALSGKVAEPARLACLSHSQIGRGKTGRLNPSAFLYSFFYSGSTIILRHLSRSNTQTFHPLQPSPAPP